MATKKAKTAAAPVQAPVTEQLVSAAEFAVLRQAIDAEAADPDTGCVYVNLADVPALVANNMIVTNPNATDDAGRVAARANQHGLTYWEANRTVDTATQTVQDEPVTRPARSSAVSFEIVDDFAPPASAKRRGGNRDAYPFDKLAVGQSFFVPATETKPEPWKSMQSTVSQAMGRYATVSATQTKVTRKGNTVPVKSRTRQFGLYQAERGGVAGAMVLRQQDAPAGTPSDAE